jgi:predicted signal transduction protein with EAL and GGDEF domain
VARLSGNDFLLLVPKLDDPKDVDRVASRVVETLAATTRWTAWRSR